MWNMSDDERSEVRAAERHRRKMDSRSSCCCGTCLKCEESAEDEDEDEPAEGEEESSEE